MSPRFKPLVALLPLAFAMQAEAIEQLAALDPILVTATRQQMRTSEVLADVTVIEREELETAGHSTLEEVLAQQPGIEFAANGGPGANSSIFTRGTSSKHTLLLIDGMRVGSVTAGDVSWSRIPTNQIDRIEILRGPASSLYGSDALGGVIQIFTRQGEGPFNINAEAGVGTYNTYSASGGFNGSQNGWRYALNLSTYKTGGFNNKRKTSGADNDRDGFENNSLSGRLGYSFAPGHEVGLNAFYSDGESRYDAGGDDRNHLILSSFNSYLKNRIGDVWTSTLSIGQSVDDSRNSGSSYSLYKTNQQQFAWQNDFKTGFGKFLLGIEHLEQKVSSTNVYQLTERTNDSAQIGWSGKFQDHQLQGNLRYDDNSQFGSKNTGSIGYGYRFTPNWRANLGYGTAFRAPSFNDLYWPFTDFGSWGTYTGNPNLKPEYARNREASIHYENGQHHVSLTWFLNRVENLIASSGGLNNMPVNIGHAQLEGATLAYDGRIGDFMLMANYNHQNPRDTDKDRLLVRRAKDYGSISIGQKLGDWDWRIEVHASGERFDDTNNTKKLDAYMLTNLYGAYRLTRDWSVFARVNNLFDENYALADGYATPGANAFIGIRYTPK
ncbi:MAG: TonB-dependent receptor [Azonexus sp.]